MLENIFILEKKGTFIVAYSGLDRLLRTILLLTLLFIYQSIEYAFVALTIHGFVRFVFLTGYLMRRYSLSVWLITVENLREQIGYVLPMGLGIIVGVLGKNADKLLITGLLIDTDFAIYSIGCLSLPFIGSMYISVGNVILPELVKHSIIGDVQSTLILWRSMVVKNAIITIPIVAFFIYEAPYVFEFLFTNEYSYASNVFRIIILTLLLQMLGYGYVLRAYGKTKMILRVKLLRTFLSLTLGYLLVNNFGLIGAALTYIFSYSFNGLYQLVLARNLLNVKWKSYLPWKDFIVISAVSLFSYAVLYLCDSRLQVTVLTHLIVNALIYFGLVLAMLSWTKHLKLLQLARVVNVLKGM